MGAHRIRQELRAIEHNAGIEFINLALKQADDKGLPSAEHFRMDGSLKAWAGHKSFERKDESGDLQ